MAQPLTKKISLRKIGKTLARDFVPSGLHALKARWIWNRGVPVRWPAPANPESCDINQFEHSVFSKKGEDGIIHRIFSVIGYASRKFFEVGIAVSQNNSLRLVLHENFQGVLVDGDQDACNLFNHCIRKKRISGVSAVCSFVTVDNIESLIRDAGLDGEIDFLSIDVDGNDFWFWNRIECCSPRVVCIEYNAGFGPDWSATVAYDPEFDRYKMHPSGFYFGCSLSSLTRLATKKEYCLVGCDMSGSNAFFVRQDEMSEDIEELIPQQAFKPSANWLSRGFSEIEQIEILRAIRQPYIEIRKNGEPYGSAGEN